MIAIHYGRKFLVGGLVAVLWWVMLAASSPLLSYLTDPGLAVSTPGVSVETVLRSLP